MCKFKLFTIAAAALMMAACSTDDIAQLINGDKKNFTATLAAPNKGGTRTAFSESSGTINVAWVKGDEIALVHNGKKDVATVSTINNDGSATITGTLTGATNGADVKLVYPASFVAEVTEGTAYSISGTAKDKMLSQDGTLKYIEENLDFREGSSTLAVTETEATLAGTDNKDMPTLNAIWGLTLSDGTNNLSATKVTVKTGSDVLASTADLTRAVSSVILAVPVSSYNAITIEATTADATYTYTKSDASVVLNPGNYYQSEIKMEKKVGNTVDLSTLTADYEAQNGDILTGTLNGSTQKYKISIAAGATVTLDNATINGVSGGTDTMFAGINCEGNATIILKDGTTNTVKGFSYGYPGIYVPENKTLTIKGETAGTGKLTASSSQRGTGAGIGGGFMINCGNIEIQGGVITASGGDDAAGIGSANNSNCGSITISGGTVNATSDNDGAGIGSGNTGTCTTITISGGTVVANSGERGAGIGSGFQGICGNISISGGTIEATGGANAAGIGTGQYGTCVDITITTGVTKVTATKGSDSPNSIGAGTEAESCGTVTIGGVEGAISTSPYTYPAPSLTYPIALSEVTSAYIGSVVTTDGNVYATVAAAEAASKTAVAMIAYVGSETGLALALADESSSKMTWNTAKSTCSGKTPTITGGTWKLASQDEWNQMINAVGGYAALRDGFSSVGGTNMLSGENDYYWSSTATGYDCAWACTFSTGNWSDDYTDNYTTDYVRACLEFSCQPSSVGDVTPLDPFEGGGGDPLNPVVTD